MSLSDSELRRYARQLALPGFGREAQEKLRNAKVLIVGMGGLGCPASLYLAAAGVGVLGICDPDRVEESNLQRQVLYSEGDVRAPKVEIAAHRLMQVNPNVEIDAYPQALDRSFGEIVAGYDVVLDATDNFDARYTINELCVNADIPMVYGSVSRFEGQLAVFGFEGSACYACAFPEAPEGVLNCAEAGVLGYVPGVIGSMQAGEAIKLITGIGEPLVDTLQTVDLLRNEWYRIRVQRDPDCPACGARKRQRTEKTIPGLTPLEVAERLGTTARPFLLDVREDEELEIAALDYDGHIPLGQLQDRIHELPSDREIVVYCHTGVRSAYATMYLSGLGFHAANLIGGIDRWVDDVDPTMRRY